MEAPATLRKRDLWITSDTHFCHDNIIQYCGRPFANAESMNEGLIEQWNSVVKPGDIVYHLGDVTMGVNHRNEFPRIVNRLNGSKRLVVGNHDDIPWLSGGGWFKKVMMWRMFPEFGLLLTHVPVHPSNLRVFVAEVNYEEGDVGTVKKTLLNVHGHIHQNPSPEGPYKCVCVEQTNYRPVHIEEILSDIKS